VKIYFVTGGELIDAYHAGGQAEVEKLIREQFGVFMYNEGRGQIINRSEYLRWKYRNQDQGSHQNYLSMKSSFQITNKYFCFNDITFLL
jgi:hypothetical protein